MHLVKKMRRRFDDPALVASLCDIMTRYHADAIDKAETVGKIKSLVRGQSDLVVDFEEFLAQQGQKKSGSSGEEAPNKADGARRRGVGEGEGGEGGEGGTGAGCSGKFQPPQMPSRTRGGKLSTESSYAREEGGIAHGGGSSTSSRGVVGGGRGNFVVKGEHGDVGRHHVVEGKRKAGGSGSGDDGQGGFSMPLSGKRLPTAQKPSGTQVMSHNPLWESSEGMGPTN